MLRADLYASLSAVPSALTDTRWIHSAIDQLRANHAPKDQLEIVPDVGVAAHRLEWAIRIGDEETDAAMRLMLQQRFECWLDTAVAAH